MSGYVGRYAPSPTGLLHAGSIVAALGSWLDARHHGGRWLLRIEDVDGGRCRPEYAHGIIAQLAALGLDWDGPILWQSQRSARYAEVTSWLEQQKLVYPCACSRQDVATWWQAHGGPPLSGELPYPGLCRQGLPAGRTGRALRVRLPDGVECFEDRRCGRFCQTVAREVGDLVLKRADGWWSYQLAVVVDDHDSGVTQVVRGEDLLDNTPRQRLLQRLLGWGNPGMLHLPLVRAKDGQKLSKQTGAIAVDTRDAVAVLQAACRALLAEPIEAGTLRELLDQALAAWPRWLQLAESAGRRPPPSSAARGAALVPEAAGAGAGAGDAGPEGS
jgi:glutamyl-Q tRNA(Asp) synthetase